MEQIKTHRIFPVEQYDGDLQFGVGLKVETFRGSRSEYHYEAVLIDPDVLANIKEQHAENIASDDPAEPPLYFAESVLAHNIDAGTMDDFVCARGNEAGFSPHSHGINHLIQLEDVRAAANGSHISPREAECMFYKNAGYSRDDTGAILGIGMTTVKSHRSRAKQILESIGNKQKRLNQTKEFADHIGFSGS